MSSVVIRQLFETDILNLPALTTQYENQIFKAVEGVAYQSIAMLLAKPENPSFTGFHREIGFFQVTLYYPINDGVGDAATRAELIRARYFQGKSWTSGQITLTVSGTPEIRPGRADGDRWLIPIRIPFYANVFG